MKALVLSALCAFFVPVTTAHAYDRPCAGESLPDIRVVSRLVQPQVDHTTPREELSNVAELTRPGETDGLTDFQVNAEVTLKTAGQKNKCILGSVDVELSPARTLVYIAKEVPESSCRFRAVYDHELKHVMLAQHALDRQTAALRRALRKTLSDILEHEAEAHLPTAMQAKMEGVVSQAVAELQLEYAKGNAELDTDAEAHRMEGMCTGPQTMVGTSTLR